MVPKDEFKIAIPLYAMEETMQVCAVALDEVTHNHMSSIWEILIRFLQKDLQRYLCISSIIFCITICISLGQSEHNSILMAWVIGIYFGLLGLLSLQEIMKNHVYKTTELFSAMYLHPGRSFLFKLAAITVLESVQCIIFYLLISCTSTMYITELILCAFIPVYIIQIMLLYVYQKIHSFSSAIGLYFVVFALYEGFLFLFHITEIFTVFTAMILWGGVLVAFALSLWNVYYQLSKRQQHYGI